METTNTSGVIAAQTEKKAVAKTEKKGKSIAEWIKVYQDQIALALPTVMTPERFTRIALSAVSKTPMLAQCEAGSFIGAMMASAQLGLEPNTPLGQAYLIPFKNNKKGIVECQFQIGYKGLIDLARRSGEIKSIEARIVYENDEFEYELGLEPKLKHIPAMENRGEMVWVYAVYHLVNGGYAFEVMSKSDVQAHRVKYSKAQNSPWNTDFEEMAKKTVLKKVLKYAPLKTDYIRGTVEDDKVINFNAETSELDFAETNEDIIDA